MGVFSKLVVIGDFSDRQQFSKDSETVATDLASLLQRVTAISIREHLAIADLQMLREKLQREAPRVQLELVKYATFTEATLRSMNDISECLRNRFHKGAA
jgi:hypothetical protein